MNYRTGLYRVWVVAAALWTSYLALIVWADYRSFVASYDSMGYEVTDGHLFTYFMRWLLGGPAASLFVLLVGFGVVRAIEWIAAGFQVRQ